MKPRPPPVEHTAADAIAWSLVHWRGGPRFGPTLFARSLLQDRADAVLMLECQRARDRTFPVDRPPLTVVGTYNDIACGGAMWDADPVWRHRYST
jgi:hypothetical protein